MHPDIDSSKVFINVDVYVMYGGWRAVTSGHVVGGIPESELPAFHGQSTTTLDLPQGGQISDCRLRHSSIASVHGGLPPGSAGTQSCDRNSGLG